MKQQDYIQLQLLAEDSPANLGVMPGSKEARQMTATSGLRCLELSKSCGPLGLLEKMLLGSYMWGSTLRYLTWKPKVTSAGRLYYQLAPWGRYTSDSDASLLPTPMATDATARDVRKEIYYTKNGTPRCLSKSGISWSIGLERYAKLWPTPTASDHFTGNLASTQQKTGSMHSVNLSDAVKMFPTPKATDSKGTDPLGSKSQIHDAERGNLRGVVMDSSNGQLNPTWVEWLMGYPLGWTALDASEMP